MGGAVALSSEVGPQGLPWATVAPPRDWAGGLATPPLVGKPLLRSAHLPERKANARPGAARECSTTHFGLRTSYFMSDYFFICSPPARKAEPMMLAREPAMMNPIPTFELSPARRT